MTKTDRSKNKKPANRVPKVLETLSLESLERLLSEDGTVAALDEAFALTMAVSEGGTVWLSDDHCESVSGADRAAFLRRLIAAKVDPNRTNQRFDPPLMALLASDIESRGALVEELLRAGADPNIVTGGKPPGMGDRTPLGRAVRTQDKGAVALLLPLASAASRLDALITAIERFGALPKQAKLLDEWLGRAGDVDAPGPSGFAPVHAAALADVAILGKVLAQAKNPGIAVAFSGELPLADATPPEGGVVPTITVRPGMNALDLVTLSLDLLERKTKEYASRDRDPRKSQRAAARDRLRANREALVQAGVAPTTAPPAAATKSEHLQAIDRQLSRLASVVGADAGKMQAALDGIDTTGKGPWGYLMEALTSLEPLLKTDRARAALKKTRLLWVHFTSADVSGFRDVKVKPALYPKEARSTLRDGVILGGIDATVFILCPHQKGVPIPARVCAAHPESFEVLGETVEDFVRNEVDAMARA